MSTLPILLLSLALASGFFMRENVVFEKIKDIKLSRSIWTITLIIDLKPYEELLDQSVRDIVKANHVINLEYDHIP